MRTLLKKIFKDNSILIFVYGITRKSSFENLDNLIEIKKKLGNNFVCSIIINKKKLFNEEVIEEEQGKNFSKKHNYKFYLLSAKDDQQTFINCLDED